MVKSVDIVSTEFAGAMKVRIADVDITNYAYDGTSTTNGELFSAGDAGLHRFQAVSPDVKYGEGSATTVQDCVAQYDWSNDSIRLLQQSDSGGTDSDANLVEVPANANEGALVRVTCYGR